MAGAQRWSAPGAGPRVRVSASRQDAIMISRFHSASTGIGIFPVEHFALLGDANLAGKISHRLGQYRGMSGAAAASHGAAAAVKEAKLHVALARRSVQVAMGFVQLPDAGQHAAVFVGIGIAQHHFLPASPGIERRLIVRGSPDPFHHRSRSAQGLDRFEKRHRHQSRVIRGSRDAHAAGGSQFRDREDVVFRLRSADDVAANRACGIELL